MDDLRDLAREFYDELRAAVKEAMNPPKRVSRKRVVGWVFGGAVAVAVGVVVVAVKRVPSLPPREACCGECGAPPESPGAGREPGR